MPATTVCLWFDTQGEEAAELYVSLFPNSKITHVQRHGPGMPGPEGSAFVVYFVLDGREFMALNGGPMFTFTEATSVQINCADQAEVDHYWDGLLADGGEASMCGWLKDRFGFSWQVVPDALPQLMADPDPGRAQRALEAMMKMRKLDVAALHAAADAG